MSFQIMAFFWTLIFFLEITSICLGSPMWTYRSPPIIPWDLCWGYRPYLFSLFFPGAEILYIKEVDNALFKAVCHLCRWCPLCLSIKAPKSFKSQLSIQLLELWNSMAVIHSCYLGGCCPLCLPLGSLILYIIKFVGEENLVIFYIYLRTYYTLF